MTLFLDLAATNFKLPKLEEVIIRAELQITGSMSSHLGGLQLA